MSYRHDEIDDNFDAETPRRSAYNTPARELTLSTPAILGIFFGLALLCAVFFGFGYGMGSKSHQAPVVSADTTAPSPTNFSTFKPAPGSPAYVPPTPAVVTPAPATTPESADPSNPTTPPQPAPVIRSTPQPAAAPTRPEASAIPASETGLTFMVQIAAVSHREDADLMVSSLTRKGYAVVIHTEPGDKFFHVQVGPFANKKDAEAIRQRLSGDGYNAILK
jgi:DedD protein